MKKLAVFFGLMWITIAYAQDIPGTGFDKIRIVLPDVTIQAELHPLKSQPQMQASLEYYWYNGNHIQTTQGGYSGRLLNGQYSVYFPNKNLKELGNFKNGLKDGLWRNWQEDGTLLTSYTWKNGQRWGVFGIYGERGQLKQSGEYRAGELEGWVTEYNNGKQQKAYYSHGAVVKNPPASFWSRINIFKTK